MNVMYFQLHIQKIEYMTFWKLYDTYISCKSPCTYLSGLQLGGREACRLSVCKFSWTLKSLEGLRPIKHMVFSINHSLMHAPPAQ